MSKENIKLIKTAAKFPMRSSHRDMTELIVVIVSSVVVVR
jgi:hypothetical protein